jgi:glycosyltransferase involved in cell wall biosynthesis
MDLAQMNVAERRRAEPRLAGVVSGRADRAVATSPPANRAAKHDAGMILNLFFEDKDDRWFRGDRHVRRILRRLLVGKPKMNGQLRVFLNLCAGLDRLGIRYRVNDYNYIQKHPDELACIIGRSFVLDRIKWKNPILLGVAIYNHPLDDPNLFKRLPVKSMLVPCEWYADMCRKDWPSVEAWPVGIDTDAWAPSSEQKTIDVLLYDKIRWERERYVPKLLEPIRARLQAEGRSYIEVRYGKYDEDDYQAALARCRSMIFLCEHESQGLACQQALSSGVPIFAWDRGGAWQDPDYFPHKVRYEGSVSSVPYWDARCGMKFTGSDGFEADWQEFWSRSATGAFKPRDYILDNLTLEKQALHYYEIAKAVMQRQKQ